MSLASKVATAGWFLRRPSFWLQAGEIIRRKFIRDFDSPALRAKATQWAADRAVSVRDALAAVGLLDSGQTPPQIREEVLKEAEGRAERAKVIMGGAGDVALIYAAASLSGSRRALETGVAYGWSSLAILAAMEENGAGRLVSVDMPYAKMNNEPFVGVVVPRRLRESWTLLRLPDRNGLKRAIRRFEGVIDLAHYDSDKSYYGRGFAYPQLWDALSPGGVFISDDIQDNFRFAEFVAEKDIVFAVTECAGKFAGICRKQS